jgi:hypothetical protein
MTGTGAIEREELGKRLRRSNSSGEDGGTGMAIPGWQYWDQNTRITFYACFKAAEFMLPFPLRGALVQVE